MINDVISSSKYIWVSTNNGANVSSGTLRVEKGQLEAYTGYAWTSVSSGNPTIGLTYQAEQAISWASKKMDEEKEEHRLIEKYPTLASAKNQYDMIKTICEAEEKLDNKNGT